MRKPYQRYFSASLLAHSHVLAEVAQPVNRSAEPSSPEGGEPSNWRTDFLAVTDRDGRYGAVNQVRACVAAGIRPGLGAELAVHGDEHRPLGRVVVLAHGNTQGREYGALCRAVSAARQLGKKPSISRARLATLAGLRSLTVLTGPASDVGQAIERRDSSDAHAALEHEMKTVERPGFAPYFLTVARVANLIREMGVRVHARGSGVGSVLNYALRTCPWNR
jgi:DNA polymerase III alpha subunit